MVNGFNECTGLFYLLWEEKYDTVVNQCFLGKTIQQFDNCLQNGFVEGNVQSFKSLSWKGVGIFFYWEVKETDQGGHCKISWHCACIDAKIAIDTMVWQ